jgi:ATP-dependent DNA helicase MPH1
MSEIDEDDYGDIADEDLIEAFSQASQTLPSLSTSPRSRKRRRNSEDASSEEQSPIRRRRQTRDSIDSGVSGDEVEEDENSKAKKKKYRIHIGNDEVPAARIVGATQFEALPDSSPYRIRGPIYRKPRPEDAKPPVLPAPRREAAPQSNALQWRTGNHSRINEFDRELNDLPSDAFSSPEKEPKSKEPIVISSSSQVLPESSLPRQRLVAPLQGLRQTTLFGGRAAEEVPASQVKKVHNFIVDKPPEAPTHHALDHEALKTWAYPTNLGTIRDYQYSIVRNGLFHNTLVALPTGLGKTFIAATIMLNFFRWTKDAQIVFVAPTKPLVAQQVDACFNIVGIPKSQTTMLTGEQVPALRAEEWEAKRVFFMTPQTLENDLSSGIADPKKIVLLVVDEAHRATGNYAYIKVVNFLRRFNKSFRVLALTATPGATVEAVQEVVDGLEISKVEIRTEESIDIQQYVHRRNIDQVLLDPSDEMIMVKELFSKALQPLVNKLCAQNAYWNKDPMSLTPFGLIQARKSWAMSDAGKRASFPLKAMMNGLFTVLASVAHGIKLLNFHGVGPFYSSMKDLRQGVEDGNKGGKYRKEIIDSPDFKKMMDRIRLWLNKDDFVGHPKLTYLCDSILNHFLDAGEGRLSEDAPPSSTRVIVFSEFRDSAEDIARVLNRHGPMIRASVFVGQTDSKRSEGMNQAKQLETIQKFKTGKLNVIVATSIGEEGLDIGQVDLIVCYDASASPIRMLQRMGRTGRKRAGNIVLLLMRGKEEDSFLKAKDNYEQMQKMISSGTRFNFRHDLSVRIIPRDVNPQVDKRVIEIPIENTQDPSLPEPKRRPSKAKKKPPKKFHMPDGVETGFQKASKLSEGGVATKSGTTRKKAEQAKAELASIPSVDSVLLNPAALRELERRYQNVAGEDLQEVGMPDLTSQTAAQRSLGPCVKVPHGQYTKRCVMLFRTLAKSQRTEDRDVRPYGAREPSGSFWNPPPLVEDDEEIERVKAPPKKRTPAPAKRKQAPKRSLVISDVDSDDEDQDRMPSGGRQIRNRAESVSEAQSEGEGDDCLNSEAPSVDSGTESLGSLEDFIDDGRESTMRSRTSPLVRSSVTPPAQEPKEKPIFVPAQFTATQETEDDDLSDVAELAGVKQTPVFRSSQVRLDSDDVQPLPGHGKRRRVVADSDSDE